MRKTSKTLAILQAALAALTAGSLVLFAVLAATIGLETPSQKLPSPAGQGGARGGAVTVEGTAEAGGERPAGDQVESPEPGTAVATSPSAAPEAPPEQPSDSTPPSVTLSLGVDIIPPVSTGTGPATNPPLSRSDPVLDRLGLSAMFPNVGVRKPGLARLLRRHRALLGTLRRQARQDQRAQEEPAGEVRDESPEEQLPPTDDDQVSPDDQASAEPGDSPEDDSDDRDESKRDDDESRNENSDDSDDDGERGNSDNESREEDDDDRDHDRDDDDDDRGHDDDDRDHDHDHDDDHGHHDDDDDDDDDD